MGREGISRGAKGLASAQSWESRHRARWVALAMAGALSLAFATGCGGEGPTRAAGDARDVEPGAGTSLTAPSLEGEWGPVMTWPAPAVHLHMLPTGKVLFFPEFAEGDVPYLWDPDTGVVRTAAPPGLNVFCAGHAFLADGKLLVAGGHVDSHVGLPTALLFDPFTESWTRIPDMNDGRWYPTVTTLATGEALVLSGEMHAAGMGNPLPQVWEPGGGAWRDLTSAVLELPYYPRAFAAPNGKVFVAGPHGTTRYLDPSRPGAWTTVGSRKVPGRSYGPGVLYDVGKVLMAGGGDPPFSSAEVIDLGAAKPAWRLVAPMSVARRHANATLLPDGTVLVTGGSSGAGFDASTAPVFHAELWDPASETWTRLGSAARYRGYHSTAVLLPDGRVLTAGGRKERTAQIFSPPYLFKGPRPEVSAAPEAFGPGARFSIAVSDAADVAQVTLVRLGSATHAFDQNQRFLRLPFTRGTGTLEVEAPATHLVAPPGHYFLFAVSSAGVPSIARVVRFGGEAVPPPPPPPPPPPAAAPTAVIPFGDVWRYDDSNIDLGTAWLARSFDDSAWKSGPAQLGYGEGDERTTLVRTSPSQPTVYFRKKVELAALPAAATITALFDDGVAVWVNGTLVFSRNVSRGLAHSASASASTENAVATEAIAVAPFVVGENVVTAVVKQLGPTSPDLSFDLELEVR